ncbi:hypothetical protein [Thermoproteus uzoniensis]|uniref:hypothetical protein n=1 Tax=Thermoproteus uzoniensis TaxID=184117 RepID=UPI00069B13CB|nr:hypothetical protein [Thermoproteus uzoniensis]
MDRASILKTALTALGVYDVAAIFLFNLQGYLLYAAAPTAVALALAYFLYRLSPAERRRHFLDVKVIGGDAAAAADRLRARVEELERRGVGGEEMLALKLMLVKALLDSGRREEARRLFGEIERAVSSAELDRHLEVMYRALKEELESSGR